MEEIRPLHEFFVDDNDEFTVRFRITDGKKEEIIRKFYSSMMNKDPILMDNLLVEVMYFAGSDCKSEVVEDIKKKINTFIENIEFKK